MIKCLGHMDNHFNNYQSYLSYKGQYNKKTIRVPFLSHKTTRLKTYHLSAKREGDEFFTEVGLVNENSNEGGFLFIMNLKI